MSGSTAAILKPLWIGFVSGIPEKRPGTHRRPQSLPVLPEQDGDHQRWLLSYADFITLLCAFFIMLYAMGEIDRTRGTNLLERVQESLGQRTEADTDAVDATEVAEPEPSPVIEFGARLQSLPQFSGEDVDTDIRISDLEIVISIAGRVLFEPNRIRLLPAARQRLEGIATELREWPYRIQVIGISPVTTVQDPWQLAAQRAAAVASTLVSDGVAPYRLEATARVARTMPGAAGSWQVDDERQSEDRVDLKLIRSATDEPWAVPDRSQLTETVVDDNAD